MMYGYIMIMVMESFITYGIVIAIVNIVVKLTFNFITIHPIDEVINISVAQLNHLSIIIHLLIITLLIIINHLIINHHQTSSYCYAQKID